MTEIPHPDDIKIPNRLSIPTTLNTYLTLKSETSEGRAFKIKTTKPRQYIVEPSLGIILPFQELQIEVKMILSKGEDIRIIQKEDHRFKIEIFKFDWRRNVEELRNYLKDGKVKGYEKKISLEACKTDEEKEKENVYYFLYYSVIAFIFCNLMKNMLL
ncbi:phosphatidylinositol-binding protein scs2 [Gurleya vavrai]